VGGERNACLLGQTSKYEGVIDSPYVLPSVRDAATSESYLFDNPTRLGNDARLGFGVLLSILILLDILGHIVWLAGNVTTG
jgi:hypothetical protein